MNRRIILIVFGIAGLFILFLAVLWENDQAPKEKEITELNIDALKFTRADLPLLVAVVVEGKLSQKSRSKALEEIIELGPDDCQINTLGSYVKRTLPEYKFGDDETCHAIGFAFARLYSKTGNDKLLQSHRLLFNAPECGPTCRHDILFVLRETGARGNVPFFSDILNDPKAVETEKDDAAYGLGVAGSDYALQRLTTMASYIFDRKIERNHATLFMMALRALQILAANGNEKANRTIRELAERCCRCEPSDYQYQEFWGMPYSALTEIGGGENRSFLESLSLENCTSSGIRQMLKDYQIGTAR